MSDLKSVAVLLRPATQDDCRQVWEWRVEETARESSFNPEPFPYEGHQIWFASKMDDPATKIFIAEDRSGHQIGYVRFDIEDDCAEISISLDKDQRRKGYGSLLIRQGSDRLLQDSLAKKIIAVVRSDNPDSLAAFQRAGFVVESTRQANDIDAVELAYEGVPQAQGPEAL